MCLPHDFEILDFGIDITREKGWKATGSLTH